ncbi:HNH endonuclease [Reichenbachiella agarivorans]|uniref:HNH endonuclease n=1 Tax=Reichenbachiella agarivorans TaxID=2979464 RepID=A0ABY6CK38_9BACT|nr:HNH endonuclease [Reichenbachiella agarivorans]UXP30873.1 HNH endonuclease [Reichenbachiella agarivorans]
MKNNVLVLNQDYSPLTICTVNRAFLLVFLNKAEMLEADSDAAMRTVNESYPKPTVIKVNRYISVPYRGVVLSRQNLFKRDNHCCQYCGAKNNLTIDHLIPRSKGGRSVWNNLVTACKSCNAKKGDMSLEKAGMRLLQLPYRPTYLMFLRDSMGELRKEWRNYLKSTKVA